jgi:magnesium transporter
MMTQGTPWPISYSLFAVGMVLVAWLTYEFLKFLEKREKNN